MFFKNWHKLKCHQKELWLQGTLTAGQSYRWERQIVSDNNGGYFEQWVGVFGSMVWWLRQENEYLLYRVYDADSIDGSEEKYNKLLNKYFRLDVNLHKLYDTWSEVDPNFKSKSKSYYGIRLLDQDVIEILFTFICSSNTTISRIKYMVEKLCTLYGQQIFEIENVRYYDFPSIESLSKSGVETTLSAEGFGYRAKYIQKAAESILKFGGNEWISNLKELDYLRAKQTLMTLSGIGAKVADCICLLSLNHVQAIPVDTHIYQVAVSKYLPELKPQKNLSPIIYNKIGNRFRELHGPYAGWTMLVYYAERLYTWRPIYSNNYIIRM